MRTQWKQDMDAWVALVAMIATLLLGAVIVSDARAEYGDVVINQYSDAAGVRPVVFPHWFHRVRYSCKACHGDLAIQLKAGGNGINMATIIDGRYCGACHNGSVAWATEQCDLCHNGKPGVPTQAHLSAIQRPLLPAASTPQAPGAQANAFNRLFKPAAKRSLPPAEDGIHDPASPGTTMLQEPLSAYAALPKAGAGVNWASAQESGKIRPLWNPADAKAQPEGLDLDIVREVKGSMPDVVFSHRTHTQVLDCANCHPAPFATEKGATKMSMASIMLGGACGTCHGRVAFSNSECRLCHSKAKAGSKK